jgi:hypothetical protein
MSYQEERLQEIADAIREVKGTTEKIPATNFASEIVGLSVVKPSGIKTITENGSYNVSNYEWAEVSVPQGNPIELSTDTEMTNALVEDNLGKVYKFTGTSDTYETDAIYIVSEVE